MPFQRQLKNTFFFALVKKVKRRVKNFLPQTLLGRGLLILFLPMLLVQVTTTYIFLDRHWQTTTKEIASHIAEKVRLAQFLSASVKEKEGIEKHVQENLGLSFKIAPLKELPSIKRSKRYPGIGFLKKSLKENKIESFRVMMDEDFLIIYFFVHVHNQKKVALVSMQAKRYFSRTTPIFLMWSLGTPLILFLIAAFFLRNQIRPITRLSLAMEKFGKVQGDQHLKPSGAVEIRQGTIAFNLMQQRLNKFLRQRSYMLAGVSHDLKTPLTRMRLTLAMMKDRESAQSVEEEVRLMSGIIDDYLAFAKGDHASHVERIPLRKFIAQVVKLYNESGTKVQYNVKKDFELQIRTSALTRALSNLIDNAVKHGDKVFISTEITKKTVQISVEDNGKGMLKSERLKMLQPFVRADSSRNVETGGVGLGLAISHDIILAHGGSLKMDKSFLGGLKVTAVLPKTPEFLRK